MTEFLIGFLVGFATATGLALGWYHFGLDLWAKRKVREAWDRMYGR